MKQRNQKLVTGLSAAMLLMGANAALAETLTVPATVTVDNAIDFQFTGELDFGTVRATAATSAGHCAIIAVVAGAAAPAVSAVAGVGADDLAACVSVGTTAALQSVGGTLERPIFTLAGLAGFSSLTLTLPAAGVFLSGTGLPPGSSRFLLGNFTAHQLTGGSTGAITTSITANGTGAASFNVGAQLATDPALATGLGVGYQNNIAYTGSFDVTVNY
jgi:hypothetical protein